jgi:hypothetical protein
MPPQPAESAAKPLQIPQISGSASGKPLHWKESLHPRLHMRFVHRSSLIPDPESPSAILYPYPLSPIAFACHASIVYRGVTPRSRVTYRASSGLPNRMPGLRMSPLSGVGLHRVSASIASSPSAASCPAAPSSLSTAGPSFRRHLCDRLRASQFPFRSDQRNLTRFRTVSDARSPGSACPRLTRPSAAHGRSWDDIATATRRSCPPRHQWVVPRSLESNRPRRSDGIGAANCANCRAAPAGLEVGELAKPRGFQIGGSGVPRFRTGSSGLRIRDVGLRMWDVGCGIRD